MDECLDRWINGYMDGSNIYHPHTETEFVRQVVCWVETWPRCAIHRFAFNYAAAERKLMFSWSLLKFCLVSEDSLERWFNLCSPSCPLSHIALSLLDCSWNYFERSHCPHMCSKNIKWDNDNLFLSAHRALLTEISLNGELLCCNFFCIHHFDVFITLCFSIPFSFLCNLKAFNPARLPLLWSSSFPCNGAMLFGVRAPVSMPTLHAQLFKARTQTWLTAPSSSSLPTWSLWTLQKKQSQGSLPYLVLLLYIFPGHQSSICGNCVSLCCCPSQEVHPTLYTL